ncbi:carcinoembryonic antigen-related cell adhesion molecule 5-like isoform X2 [Thalassophryne amazonica]|uniref:carcinoembryonic antigen-related cell adhesion molecule 5-like isoform X2 n=1 Tax=Thalassophryne amazonica TaxID=390379 RepID=UPI0014716E50|nr:carcinoembryonic antigen-related cell adhesion molecule 5-like isoform X2 [Thalassophryne amazonica]
MALPLVCVLILAIISFVTDSACSQRIYASENPVPVGSSVTFFVNGTFSDSQAVWSFNGTIILLVLSGTVTENDAWKDRMEFNSTTGSLTIRSLQVDDSGDFTLQKINSFISQVSLSVQVPISNVTLSTNEVNLIEFNDTAILTCSVSNGTSLIFVWLNGSSVVNARGDVHISNQNSILTIPRVTQYDQGPFRCNVSNGVSKEQSQPLRLNISYGPNNGVMTRPMGNAYRTGSTITLSCSAESSPPALIQWLFNSSSLNYSEPQLQLRDVTKNQSGKYECLFYNPVTFRYSSASAMIRILDPITSVMVKQTGGIPEVNASTTLHCKVTGSVDNILWLKNGIVISHDNRTILDMNNKTITIEALQPSDSGDYQCQAINPVSNMTSSPYTVHIIYGPNNLRITGPKTALVGSSVTFNCTAESWPMSDFKWYFNGSLVANTSKYETPPLTFNMSGTYTCMAHNNITGQNATANTMLTVLGPLQNVQIEAPSGPAISGQTYSLTCSVTGFDDNIYWMKNDSFLQVNPRIVLSNQNTMLTFSPTQANDTGNYKCVAVSSVRNETSPAYALTVNFGPQTPIIEGPSMAKQGEHVNFNCSAVSVPPSNISWWFNGSLLAQTASLQVGPLSLSMSGEYTCMANNDVTKNNNTNSVVLTVIVMGFYNTIYWLKNGTWLSMTNETLKQMINNTLQFTPVTLSDEGIYQCEAVNYFGSNRSAEYNLLVNYGPLSVGISGIDYLKENPLIDVVLTCFADSRPTSFKWFFNSGSSAISTQSFVKFVAKRANGGNYTCEATNPVTNIAMKHTKAVIIDRACVLCSLSKGSLMFLGVFALALPVLLIG